MITSFSTRQELMKILKTSLCPIALQIPLLSEVYIPFTDGFTIPLKIFPHWALPTTDWVSRDITPIFIEVERTKTSEAAT